MPILGEMKALNVLYGGELAPEAFLPVFDGASAFEQTLERARKFPGTEKIVLLCREGETVPGLPPEVTPAALPDLSRKSLLEALSRLSAGLVEDNAAGFDLLYFAWVDSPLLDPDLAGAIARRHLRYRADYSYGDGWPGGMAPEVLAPGTPGILARLLERAGGSGGPVTRDTIFQVLQRDINNFDIETEISPVDLRRYRLSLTADSKRNLLLLKNLVSGGLSSGAEAAAIIENRPDLLRTLPNFFAIQVVSACPQDCSLCPWPGRRPASGGIMDLSSFRTLLDRIAAFAGDGVIDLSLWGELSLHPQGIDLIRACLERRELSLIVETSGIGWRKEELEALARAAREAPARLNRLAPLSWVLSLDAWGSGRYLEVRGPGQGEAVDCARRLLRLFPEDTYLQAVRCQGAEDDIEEFYRRWKEEVPSQKNLIIQKYDDFCGVLPRLQTADLSPIRRLPCWHLLRDMTILPDGRVPVCREDLAALNGGGEKGILGNVFEEPLEAIWERGKVLSGEQGQSHYEGICAECDEYYTYNY